MFNTHLQIAFLDLKSFPTTYRLETQSTMYGLTLLDKMDLKV